jgi:hypothetical protein
MQNELIVLDSRGDTKLMWDAEKPEEVESARALFDSLKAKRYLAFSVQGKEGSRGELVQEFEPGLGRIILAPAMAGG